MKKENGNDLLLAKRRILVMLPFLLINLSISIIMLVFISIVYNKIYVLRDDYQIDYNDFQYENNSNCDRTLEMIKTKHNFSDIFHFGQNMTRLENPVTVGLGYSITSIICLISLLLIAGC